MTSSLPWTDSLPAPPVTMYGGAVYPRGKRCHGVASVGSVTNQCHLTRCGAWQSSTAQSVATTSGAGHRWGPHHPATGAASLCTPPGSCPHAGTVTWTVAAHTPTPAQLQIATIGESPMCLGPPAPTPRAVSRTTSPKCCTRATPTSAAAPRWPRA